MSMPTATDRYKPVIECCRECRDGGRTVFAEFILWGKLFPPEALGPRCYDHTSKYVGWAGMGRIDQWAVLDLRHLYRRTAQCDRGDPADEHRPSHLHAPVQEAPG